MGAIGSQSQPPRRESGQVVVLFALLIPVLFAIGAIVIDVGNWYVLKRHLQTQVDAAAFAGGTQFTGCFNEDPNQVSLANQAIRNEALTYAGDTAREALSTNRQLEEPDDVRVVLNSSGYWTQADGPLPGSDGYGRDDTIATPGDPCAVRFLDVKATDDEAPLLWGLIPITPSPKSHARVQIEKAEELQGVLPWAVPDVDPLAVAAIFVDEDTGEVLYRSELVKQSLPANDPLAGLGVWALDFADFDVTREDIGVIVLVSKEASPPLPSVGSGPPYTCNQAPRRWACYSGDGSQDGLAFIHGYDDEKAGTAADPAIMDVRLTPGSCSTPPENLSAPYFVLNAAVSQQGTCTVGIEAVIDFGVGGNPTGNPTRAEVSANGGNLGWSSGGPFGVWSGTITLPDEGGRQVIDLDWQTGQGNNRVTGSFNKVAVPYVADDDPSAPGDSGPVWYLSLTTPSGGFANSLPDNGAGELGPTVHVTVGLKPALTSGQLVGLRVSSDNPSSKTQAIDCDKGISMDEEILNGCRTPFALNYKDWDSNPSTPFTWRDIECWDYNPANNTPTFRYALPPDPPYNPTPRPDCGRLQTGVTNGEFGKGMRDRFESPCTPMLYNNWSTPDEEANDPRWVTLVVTDGTAFEGSGGSPADTIPVKILGSFYVAGWTAVAQAQGCSDNLPPPAGVGRRVNRGDVWGYFRKFVVPSAGGTGSGELCSYDGFETCIAVLVE